MKAKLLTLAEWFEKPTWNGQPKRPLDADEKALIAIVLRSEAYRIEDEQTP